MPCTAVKTEAVRHSVLFGPVVLEAPSFLESKSDELTG